MHVVVVGATGMVGQKMLDVLAERKFPCDQLSLVASAKSVGKEVEHRGQKYRIISMEEAIAARPDFALFSAGGEVSKKYAPQFAENGTCVIDNSSAWRMDEAVKLIVPEVNGGILDGSETLIANPNCSTIQLVMVLRPLHQKYGLARVIISTYQSVTGTGKKAVDQMENERLGKQGAMAYPYPIDRNVLPHCDVFTENGYTKEEMKLLHETRKILGDKDIPLSTTAVRVPVQGGHSESVNLELQKEFELRDIRKLLSETPGVVVQDNIDMNVYPMPRYAHEKDEVFVGRIRRDLSRVNCLNLWIVSDNLRKGAATNTVQIAEKMRELKGL